MANSEIIRFVGGQPNGNYIPKEEDKKPNEWGVFGHTVDDVLQEESALKHDVDPELAELQEIYEKHKEARVKKRIKAKKERKVITKLRDLTKPEELTRNVNTITLLSPRDRFKEIRRYVNEEYKKYEPEFIFFSSSENKPKTGMYEHDELGRKILPEKTAEELTVHPRRYGERTAHPDAQLDAILERTQSIFNHAQELEFEIAELKETVDHALDERFEFEYEPSLAEFGDLPYILNQYELLPEYKEKRAEYLKKRREDKKPDDDDLLSEDEAAAEDLQTRTLLDKERRIREWVWWFSHNDNEDRDRRWIKKKYKEVDHSLLQKSPYKTRKIAQGNNKLGKDGYIIPSINSKNKNKKSPSGGIKNLFELMKGKNTNNAANSQHLSTNNSTLASQSFGRKSTMNSPLFSRKSTAPFNVDNLYRNRGCLK